LSPDYGGSFQDLKRETCQNQGLCPQLYAPCVPRNLMSLPSGAGRRSGWSEPEDLPFSSITSGLGVKSRYGAQNMNLLTLVLAAAVSFAGQPDTLDVARVTARRSDAASSSSPLQTVSALAIERSGATGLNEVVRSFSGVSVKDYGGVGGLKTVSVRGLGTQHTAVCYDGVLISDAQNGQIDISRFGLEDLSRITMQTGSSDDIFRPARTMTSSGVLSLESVAPVFEADRKLNTNARMRFASFGTYNPYLGLSCRLNSVWSAKLTADWLWSDGVYPFVLKNGDTLTEMERLNSDVQSLNAALDVYGDFSKAGRLHAKLSMYDSERGLPGSVVYYTQDPTERLSDRDLKASIKYDVTPAEHLKIRLSANLSDASNTYINTSALYPKPEVDNYDQKEASLGSIVKYSPWEHISFAYAQDLSYNTLDSDIPESQFPQRVTSVSALLAQYVSDRLTATAGLSETLAHESVRVGSAAPDRARLSPFASVSFALLEGLRARASYTDGFRVPTFNDLYYAKVGNRNLRPEKARQFNVGLTFSKGLFELTADVYSNKVKDKIVAIPTMFIWKMHNVGEVQMYGADIAASGTLEITPEVTLRSRVNYSYAYAVDVTDPDSKAYMNQVQYTPRHSANAVVSLEMPYVNVSYTLNAVGERYFLAQNLPANRMEPYFDHGLSFNRNWTLRGMKIRVAAEALNLGDVNYEVVRFYPMPGRNYRLTIKIQY